MRYNFDLTFWLFKIKSSQQMSNLFTFSLFGLRVRENVNLLARLRKKEEAADSRNQIHGKLHRYVLSLLCSCIILYWLPIHLSGLRSCVPNICDAQKGGFNFFSVYHCGRRYDLHYFSLHCDSRCKNSEGCSPSPGESVIISGPKSEWKLTKRK